MPEKDKMTSLDVTLEITRKCPLACMLCSSHGGIIHPNELGLDKWIHLVDEAVELGASSFLISGGEPFTSPFLFELSRYIHSKNVSLTIYSSGNIGENIIKPIPITELEKIANVGKILIVMSLESAEQDIHEKITQKENSYQNTLQTIRNCIDLGLSVELHFVPTKINYRELPNVIELALSLGVKKVSVLRFVPQGRGKENREKLELNENELEELKSIFQELEKYGDYVRIGSPFNPFLLSKQYVCTAGTNRLSISYDGYVFSCEAYKFLDRNNENNLKNNSLRKIFNMSQLFEETRIYQHKLISDVCKNCSFFILCRGGCPAQKILYRSIIDPICQIGKHNIISKAEINV